MTEIGISHGQSLQVWHDYFTNAHIWGVDIQVGVIKAARRMFREHPRVHILRAYSKAGQSQVPALGLEPAASSKWISFLQRIVLSVWPAFGHSPPPRGAVASGRLLSGNCHVGWSIDSLFDRQEPESMDVVIDDGDHYPPSMDRTLVACFVDKNSTASLF